MARISDIIEKFIVSMMTDTEKDILEIQRNELAEHFKCAPSQINYVLATRFTPEKGYYIESKRGGGGYIKIIRVNIKEEKDIRKLLINSIGNSITTQKSYNIIDNLNEKEFITNRESLIMKNAISNSSLSLVGEYKNELRAKIFKYMLISLLSEE
ncbi:CtsR family transcriptional regulator [Senegalia massiliensis]|uniref:Transcriptional regulator CtsR n=1 Tax=Senegalia massiliensis TaxID=1720316 RepID=A0A845R0R4_9CLOT|nr:CtsR family transcriptional regulator [Senegalia massiliensis]NBI08020.1 CtsR family transcriptional regulator [Senegalia massiliensis]